jgi:predicted metalloprotease with PDZ domain
MRGINLDLFDFDYDLTWAAFFMHPDGTVYGRYGSRDADSSDKQVSMAGLRFAMQQALIAHRGKTPQTLVQGMRSPRTVDQFPPAKRLKENACIHCHQVYDFRREALQAAGKWRQEEVWIYPQPENIGIRLDVEQGNRVTKVLENFPADRIGIQKGAVLVKLNGHSIGSQADVQYALHKSPTNGSIPVIWNWASETKQAQLELAPGWRRTDISWRWSLRGLDPQPGVHGEDLSGEEKKALGLSEKSMAFRQGNFVTPTARLAGLRQNDIIIGFDHKSLTMTARQLGAYIRLNYQVGDKVSLHVLRHGQRLDLTMELTGRKPF